MTGKPAATLLHLGPGFANGVANLHNARRARTPIVNWIGDQASWHLAADAPLTSDIAAVAGSVGWVRTNTSAERLAADGAAAIAAAYAPPGQVASLVIPADFAWEEAPGPAAPEARPEPSGADPAAVSEAARLLVGERAVLFLGGPALGERGLRAAHRIAEARGCRVLLETFSARTERGLGHPDFARLPYFPEQGREALGEAESLVLAGCARAGGLLRLCRPAQRARPGGGSDPRPRHPARGRGRRPGGAGRRDRGTGRPDLGPGPAPSPRAGRSASGRWARRWRRSSPRAASSATRPPPPGSPSRLRWQRTRAHLARADRRRHRPGAAGGGGCRDRVPRPAGGRLPGRRLRPLHRAGALDDGPRGPRRDGGHLREPRLPHPPGRAGPRGHRRAGPAGDGPDGAGPA